MGKIESLKELYNDLSKGEIKLSEIVSDYKKLGSRMMNEKKYAKYSIDFQILATYIEEEFGTSLKKLAQDDMKKEERKNVSRKSNSSIRMNERKEKTKKSNIKIAIEGRKLERSRASENVIRKRKMAEEKNKQKISIEEGKKLIFPDAKDISYYEEKYPRRNLPEGAIVTRFAPSPTGFVHIGGLYQALVARTAAEKSKGVFILRIEDTDQKREIENGTEGIIQSLKDFDMMPDEGKISKDEEIGNYGPYQQSLRKDIYQA